VNNVDNSNLTILVTGGCGYLGSQLIRDFYELKNELGSIPTIRILDNMESGKHNAIMNLPPDGKYQFIEGDILDPAALRRSLDGVDVVVHLAAKVNTPLSFNNPGWVQQVNQWGTAALVDACAEKGVQRIIYTSDTAVYGPGITATEGDVCKPLGSYAQSKFEGEKYIQLGTNRGVNSTILRFGTFCGRSTVTRFESVANKLAFYAGVNRALTVYGDGKQTRPFITIKDASDAILFSILNSEDTSNAIFNVASENFTVLDIVERIQTNKPETRVRYVEQDIRTRYNYEASSNKFHSIGWKPKYPIYDALEDIINLFQGFDKLESDVNANEIL